MTLNELGRERGISGEGLNELGRERRISGEGSRARVIMSEGERVVSHPRAQRKR